MAYRLFSLGHQMQRLVLSAEHSLLSGKKESGGKVSINSCPQLRKALQLTMHASGLGGIG
jgi:hypothetical protein